MSSKMKLIGENMVVAYFNVLFYKFSWRDWKKNMSDTQQALEPSTFQKEKRRNCDQSTSYNAENFTSISMNKKIVDSWIQQRLKIYCDKIIHREHNEISKAFEGLTENWETLRIRSETCCWK